MKILDLMQADLLIFGSPQRPFNQQNLPIITSFILGIISACIYLYRDAKTFLKYSNSIFVITVVTVAATIYGIVVSRLPELLDFVVEAQNVIDGSEFLD